MKIFKTKNKHSIAFGRQIIQTEVFLKISKLEFDENGVIPQGYYYIIINDQPEKLDNIFPSIFLWEQIGQVEQHLSELKTTSLKEAIYTRAEEFTRMKLQAEGTSNYGIAPDDWQEYVEPKKTLETSPLLDSFPLTSNEEVRSEATFEELNSTEKDEKDV